MLILTRRAGLILILVRTLYRYLMMSIDGFDMNTHGCSLSHICDVLGESMVVKSVFDCSMRYVAHLFIFILHSIISFLRNGFRFGDLGLLRLLKVT